MKKLTRRGFTAAGILAALGAGITSLPGCRLLSCNVPETVYGPPSWFDPSNNEVEDVYGPPDVDPSEWDSPSEDVYEPDENEAVAVYGPPEWFGYGIQPDGESDDDGQDDQGTGTQIDGEGYDASDNIAQSMYGPMEPYDPDDAD